MRHMLEHDISCSPDTSKIVAERVTIYYLLFCYLWQNLTVIIWQVVREKVQQHWRCFKHLTLYSFMFLGVYCMYVHTHTQVCIMWMKLFFILPWLSVWSGEVNIKVFLTRLSLFWHVLKGLCAACHCHTDRLHPDRFYLLCILTEQDRERETERGQTGGKNKEVLQNKGGWPDIIDWNVLKGSREEEKLRRVKSESGDLQIRGKGWRENFFFSLLLSLWDLSLQKSRSGERKQRRMEHLLHRYSCRTTRASPLSCIF